MDEPTAPALARAPHRGRGTTVRVRVIAIAARDTLGGMKAIILAVAVSVGCGGGVENAPGTHSVPADDTGSDHVYGKCFSDWQCPPAEAGSGLVQCELPCQHQPYSDPIDPCQAVRWDHGGNRHDTTLYNCVRTFEVAGTLGQGYPGDVYGCCIGFDAAGIEATGAAATEEDFVVCVDGAT